MRETHAIQTRYRGYRFRSRLEARWAVFFDALGHQWEYEKEGFALDGQDYNGNPLGYYLPDFWLPEMNAWVEIKGSLGEPPTGSSPEELRLMEVVRATRTNGFLYVGIPGQETPYTRYMSRPDGSIVGPDCGRNFVMSVFSAPVLQRSEPDLDLAAKMILAHFEAMAAFDAARSARFEFGEEGAPR